MPRESIQRKPERVKPPRVQISYDVATGAAVENRELPLVIGVLGDFSGASERRPAFRDRKFLHIDWDSFNEVMANLATRARFGVPSSLAGSDLQVDLTFACIEDFEPEKLTDRMVPLRELRQCASLEASEVLHRHIDCVLHAPEFQALESAWRGLWYLASRAETSPSLQIKVLDVSKRELVRDFQRSAEFDQSELFRESLRRTVWPIRR
jgi:type VI secretion system protein ImpB